MSISRKNIYDSALSLLNLEANLVGSIFTSFLLAHSIIIGSLIQSVLNKDFNLVLQWNIKIFIFCLLGLFLSLIWLVAYLRGSSFYALRISQARFNEPEGYFLYKNVDNRFVKGEEIVVGNERIKIDRIGKLLSVKTVIVWLIRTFSAIYLLGLISFGPWFNEKNVIAPSFTSIKETDSKISNYILSETSKELNTYIKSGQKIDSNTLKVFFRLLAAAKPPDERLAHSTKSDNKRIISQRLYNLFNLRYKSNLNAKEIDTIKHQINRLLDDL